MNDSHVGPRRAFTLVEMLVVMVVIGVLIALLIPVIGGATRRGKNAAIFMELNDLARAIEAYKAKTGDYPPDFTNQLAVVAHMKKAYPRCNTARVVQWLNNSIPNVTLNPDPRNLDPAEALVFWLTMTKNNPRDPLTGSGEYVSYFTFDQARLASTDFDGDGWPEYTPARAAAAPYVYFDGRILSDSSSGMGQTCAYAWALYPTPYNAANPSPKELDRSAAKYKQVFFDPRENRARPYRSSAVSASTDTWPTAANPSEWLEPGKFQIIHAGLDGHFGNDVTSGNPADPLLFKQFPAPNYTITPEDYDNLTSFSGGSTVGDSVP